ncbi:hypothetical protein IFM89_029283 [Coptis chinensis]|uniref:Uncharacterized protein n=1 Tax=Coptis chinensis TaxID=261450 RepID=A0A835HW57_9MAGN|nr:hypothetical protein IFM89_029283 [Coptis chinensis]
MESNGMLRGFVKGMSFTKSSKPSSIMKKCSDVKPSAISSNASATSFHFDKEFAIPPPVHKISHVKSSDSEHDSIGVDNYGSHGAGLATADETVDRRAAAYISNVRERFRQEKVDSDQIAF